jgi:RND family efflux transporter MFP subunit
MLKAVAPIGAVLFIGFGALFVSSCSRNPGVQASDAGVSDVQTVAVAKVMTQDLSRNLVLTAEFKPYQEVDVMAKVAGYIKEINVDVGDRVKEGDLLATLEIPEMKDDLNRARAAVERSNADVTHAEDEVRRAESAHSIAHLSYQRLAAVSEKRPGLVAQQEIDVAQSKDLEAEAQVAAAKSALGASKEQVHVNSSDVDRVNTMKDYTKVTAPFTGVVTKRYADKGSMIQAGTASQTQAMPVVRISENSLLRLILPVPESAVPTVHIGQQVDVRVPTLNRSFPGLVKRFDEKLSMDTRTMNTEVDVPNANLVLIPGMYAEVDLRLEQRNRVLAVPVTAVDNAAEESSTGTAHGARAMGQVMVVTPNNRVEVRKIALGLETANKVEVLSGLNDGDMVVIGGRAGLRSGQEVRPKVVEMAASKS